MKLVVLGGSSSPYPSLPFLEDSPSIGIFATGDFQVIGESCAVPLQLVMQNWDPLW